MLRRIVSVRVTKAAMRDERGQTLVEYGLLLGLISVALIFAISSIATQLVGFLTSFNAGLSL